MVGPNGVNGGAVMGQTTGPLPARTRELFDYVRPHLESDEKLVAVLVRSYRSVSHLLALGSRAIVATNRRLFAIQLQRITRRPKTILDVYARDSITIKWTPNAFTSGSEYWGRQFWDLLTVTGSFGTNEFWVDNQVMAGTFAKALKTVGTQ